MKFEKKINIYFTVTKLAEYMYYLLKYISTKLKNKRINFKVISSELPKKENWILNKPKILKSKFFKDIKWINPNKKYSWYDLDLKTPEIYFQSGWNTKSFKYLAKITRQKNSNSKIILTSDNSYQKNNVRQTLGRIFFKTYLRKKFHFAWVPGFSSKKLMIKFGFEKKKIFSKVYSSITGQYKNHTAVKKRKKQFLFVGQFIKRKNVERLVEAFESLNINKKLWRLILVGKGKLDLKKYKTINIKIFDHLPPSELSKLYDQSLFFILPSTRDHWPLVGHEASRSGCFLLLSKNVGNIPEFANKKNSIIFDPNSKDSIEKTLIKAMFLQDKLLVIANKESERVASFYNYENTYQQFIEIIKKCIEKKILKIT
jgi:glycosyltransferase involved in cell wall biosynthesis